MNLLEPLFDTTVFFRLTTLSWLELIDLLLVAMFFYLLLSLVRRSRVAFLVRGVLILSGVLFVVSIVLPLPAFDWLVRGALIAVLVATPIIFQADLRRLLERIGRSTGMTWEARQTAAEQVLPNVVRAVENMSASRTGALIVLEGNNSLQDIAETGVTIGGQVTSELLQAIFYPSNPLHDGAVILREEKIIAASCVLPLAQHPLKDQRRLGTRHRAAVGLSESSDALVIVVSEETGQVSVARDRVLHRPLDVAALRKHLLDFYTPSAASRPTLSLWGLIRQTISRLWQHPPLPAPRQLPSQAGSLFISLLLAWATWTFVTQQTNPARRDRFENVPLQVVDIPAGTKIVETPPDTISIVFETTDKVRPTLSPRSFQATVSLAGLTPGLHRLPVQVHSSVSQVRLLSVEPPALDLTLAPIVTRTIEVSVELSDQQNLSRAYQIVGSPVASPGQVELVGAKPLVDQVSRVQATLSVANASTTLNETLPVRALDETGREVAGITVKPAQVRVRVTIQRRINAQDVGVRVVTEGTPAAGYWMNSLNVTPANITLQGEPDQLAQIGNFVDTLPVDISNAAGDISIQVPLDLPPGVQALDSSGNTAKTVAVQAKISPLRGNLIIARPVELIGVPPGITATVTPDKVDLILAGPEPTLNAIESNAELVQVIVEATDLKTNATTELSPTVIAPDDINAHLVPPTVSVRLSVRVR